MGAQPSVLFSCYDFILRVLPCINDSIERAHTPPRIKRKTSRPENKPIRGHRFSKDCSSDEESAPHSNGKHGMMPTSPQSSCSSGLIHPDFAKPPIWPPPPLDAPCILLLDPGSGDACGALLEHRGFAVHLAVPTPEYDTPVRRYPPHWRSMRSVKLHEREVEAELLAEEALKATSSVAASWPSVHDLRGSAHPRNLATWAGALYNPTAKSLAAVDLAATGCDRASARDLTPSLHTEGHFSCLVCGSRGGEVTLPALWLLGCRLPAVVINGGCAREPAKWVWPAGVPVVLVTGGRDKICNEFVKRDDRDAAYCEQLWNAVPKENKSTTAILHLPDMSHRPDSETLKSILPCVIKYAAAGLSRSSKPTAKALSRYGKPVLLVTVDNPAGEGL